MDNRDKLTIKQDQCMMRQRKTSQELLIIVEKEPNEQEKKTGERRILSIERSLSIDSGVHLTPPPSPHVWKPSLLPLPSPNFSCTQGQHQLAFNFILEQEMGLEKMKID